MSTVKPARISVLRRISGAAVVAALVFGGVFAATAPASAGTGDCSFSGNTCLWKDTNYVTGGIGWIYKEFANGIQDLRKYNWDFGHGNVNDNVSSAYNNGNKQTSYLFYDLNFRTQMIGMPIKSGVKNLTIGDNKATSAGFSFCVTNPTSAKCI